MSIVPSYRYAKNNRPYHIRPSASSSRAIRPSANDSKAEPGFSDQRARQGAHYVHATTLIEPLFLRLTLRDLQPDLRTYLFSTRQYNPHTMGWH